MALFSKLVVSIVLFSIASKQISAAPPSPPVNPEIISAPAETDLARRLSPPISPELKPRDEDEANEVEGPGSAGILAGLTGIFANIVNGNLGKLVESTFNFVPPVYQNSVKSVYNSLLGKPPQKATTEAPASGSGQSASAGQSGGSKTATATSAPEQEEIEEVEETATKATR